MTETTQQIWWADSIVASQSFHDKSIKSIITDPPFGVDNQSNSSVTPSGKEHARKIANDESPEKAWEVFEKVMSGFMPKMQDESDIYVVTSWQVLGFWLTQTQLFFPRYGFTPKGVLVWAKSGPGMGDLNSWGQAMEYAMYFKRGNRQPLTKRANGFFQVPQVRPSDLIHPHEKPIELLKRWIEHSTEPGDMVVDPFGGSGSLARAAREVNRHAVCIELDENNYRKALEGFTASSGGGLF